MEENWRWWKRNLFSRYNRNPSLKRIEEEKYEYKRGMVEEWNKDKDEENWWRIEENRKYLTELEDENQDISNLKDLYNKLWEVLRTRTLERGMVSWTAQFL